MSVCSAYEGALNVTKGGVTIPEINNLYLFKAQAILNYVETISMIKEATIRCFRVVQRHILLKNLN